jgi:hypothetical protein
MLPLAPVTFPAAFPAVRPSGVGGGRADSDEAAVLARLERDLELQVRLLARAFANRARARHRPLNPPSPPRV